MHDSRLARVLRSLLRMLPALLFPVLAATAGEGPPPAVAAGEGPGPDARTEDGPLPTELGVVLYPYEPLYFAIDPGLSEGPLSAKFQISLAVRLLDLSPGDASRDGLYAAYSQTSFWDLQSESKPFFDSSYRPEAWWHVGLPDGAGLTGLGLEPGVGHESNGKGGSDSRSMNHVFLRAIGRWTAGDLTVFASPRVRYYVEKEDNPDIPRYRGYVDLSGGLRMKDGVGLSLLGRIGSRADRGSLQVEITHPIAPLTGDSVPGFLYLQWYAGYGETLLAYDERSPQPRVMFGYALVR